MLHKSNFSIETAVANCSGAMEADTISKNGRILKSQMSRENFLKLIVFFIVICTSVGAWGQTFRFVEKTEDTGEFWIEIDLNKNTILYDGDMCFLPLSERSYSIISFKKYNEGNSIVIGFSINCNGSKYYDYCKVKSDKVIFGNTRSTKQTVFNTVQNDFNALVKAIDAKTATTTPNTPKSSMPNKPPSGKIERVWLEHNVYKNGEYGMNIHTNFKLYNMKGKTGVLMAVIIDSNGKEIIKQLNYTASSPEIEPLYDNAEYTDYVIFKSYNDNGFQPLSIGKTDLKVQVWLFDLDMTFSDKSNYVYFTFSK